MEGLESVELESESLSGLELEELELRRLELELEGVEVCWSGVEEEREDGREGFALELDICGAGVRFGAGPTKEEGKGNSSHMQGREERRENEGEKGNQKVLVGNIKLKITGYIK